MAKNLSNKIAQINSEWLDHINWGTSQAVALLKRVEKEQNVRQQEIDKLSARLDELDNETKRLSELELSIREYLDGAYYPKIDGEAK